MNRTSALNPALPQPPSLVEKYAYMAKHSNRWALAGSMLAVGFLAISLLRMAFSHLATLPVAFVAVILLLVPIVGGFTALRRKRFSRDEHERMVQDFSYRAHPPVAVFLPSAGEDMDVLMNTYHHVAALEWPGLVRVFVLDDSGRDEVREATESFGFQYHSRPDRGHMKKAGNLLYGYGLLRDEQYILVLDADFAPRPDMLSEMVPYFYQGENLGIVQSPQFFDTGGRMNWLQSGAGATQEFFYRWVQPARDKLGSPICVGTCAVYSVEALRAAGGFAQIEHSEDVHTGVKLRKAGYGTRYVPVNLAKGVCPDNLRGFINQQYRWCAGSMSLLRDMKFHQMRIPIQAKLCFWSGFLYYITTALLVFGSPITSMVMLWGYPTQVHYGKFVAYLPILLFSWVLIPKVMHARWGLEVYRVQYIYSMAHAVAIYDTFLRGRTAAWVPTGAAKSGNSLDKKVKRLMFTWIVVSVASFWSGLGHLAYLYGANVWPLLLLGAMQLVVQVPIALPLSSPYASRDAVRRFVTAPYRAVRLVLRPVVVKVVTGVTVLAMTLSACGPTYHALPKHSELSTVPRVKVAPPKLFDFSGPAGTKADPSIFSYQVGGTGWGNDEKQFYTDRATNAALDGQGDLVLTARREKYAGNEWTSARLTTAGKWGFTYGTVSAVLKVPSGQGVWPSFWFLGSGKWPESGEIDVMETNGNANSFVACGHAGVNDCTRSTFPSTLKGFHTWSVTKEPNFIEIDLDGKPLNIFHRKAGRNWPYNAPMAMILNVAVGGRFSGPTNRTTPDAMSLIVKSISYKP